MSSLVRTQLKATIILTVVFSAVLVVGSITRIRLLIIVGAVGLVAAPYVAVYIALRWGRGRARTADY